jgi:hypothetical protein
MADAKMRQPSGRMVHDLPDQNWVRIVIVALGSISYIFATSIITSKVVYITDVSLWIVGCTIPGMVIGLRYLASRRNPHRRVLNWEMIALAGWTASMVAFVLLRVYFLSDYFESEIFANDPNFGRYMLLSAIYTLIGYSFTLSLLFLFGRRPFGDRNSLIAVPVQFAGSTFFFCMMVFYVPHLLRL